MSFTKEWKTSGVLVTFRSRDRDGSALGWISAREEVNGAVVRAMRR